MDYEPLPVIAALSLVFALSSCSRANKPLHSNALHPPASYREDKKSTVARRWTAGSWQYVLHSELVRSHGDAVDELHGAPETMEFHALVHVHHPIAGQGPAPDGIVQEGADPRQDNLEHGQAAAEAFFGQQVPFPCDCYLLRWRERKRKILCKSHLTTRALFKNKKTQNTTTFFSFTWFIPGELSPDFK